MKAPFDYPGNIIPETEVLAHLSHILNENTPAPEFPVSTLTSEHRDTWTDARIQLIKAGQSFDCSIEYM